MTVRYEAILNVSEATVLTIAKQVKEKYVRKPKITLYQQTILGLLYLIEHKPLQQLANEFGISLGTAHSYNKTTFGKLGLSVLVLICPNFGGWKAECGQFC